MKNKNTVPCLLAILFTLVALFSAMSGDAQTIKQDDKGNYYAVKDTRTDSVKVIETGKTYRSVNGEIFKVYQSAKGKLFIYRQSKSGNIYKYYLKLD